MIEITTSNSINVNPRATGGTCSRGIISVLCWFIVQRWFGSRGNPHPAPKWLQLAISIPSGPGITQSVCQPEEQRRSGSRDHIRGSRGHIGPRTTTRRTAGLQPAGRIPDQRDLSGEFVNSDQPRRQARGKLTHVRVTHNPGRRARLTMSQLNAVTSAAPLIGISTAPNEPLTRI